MSGLQSYNMGHNGHGISMYGILMILMGNLHAGGHSAGGLSFLVYRSNGMPRKEV